MRYRSNYILCVDCDEKFTSEATFAAHLGFRRRELREHLAAGGQDPPCRFPGDCGLVPAEDGIRWRWGEPDAVSPLCDPEDWEPAPEGWSPS